MTLWPIRQRELAQFTLMAVQTLGCMCKWCLNVSRGLCSSGWDFTFMSEQLLCSVLRVCYQHSFTTTFSFHAHILRSHACYMQHTKLFAPFNSWWQQLWSWGCCCCGSEGMGRVLLYNLGSIGGLGEVEQFISRFSPTFTERSRSVIRQHYNGGQLSCGLNVNVSATLSW